MDKQSLVQYITADEANDGNDENLMSNLKPSMLGRSRPSTSQQRSSVSSRMAKGKTPESFVFRRPKGDKHLKFSISTKIKIGRKSSSPPLQQ